MTINLNVLEQLMTEFDTLPAFTKAKLPATVLALIERIRMQEGLLGEARGFVRHSNQPIGDLLARIDAALGEE